MTCFTWPPPDLILPWVTCLLLWTSVWATPFTIQGVMVRLGLALGWKRALPVLGGLLIPVTWMAGLFAAHYAQAYDNGLWFELHWDADLDESFGRGDAPNVFAGWVLMGWIPVIVGHALSRLYLPMPVSA